MPEGNELSSPQPVRRRDHGAGPTAAAELRGPRVDHRAPHGIPGLVRDQRRLTPHAVACSDPERSLTYTELDLLSDAMAAAVLDATGGRAGAVALRMPRGTDLLVALLGVLKAGCHYVPLATDEPAARMRAMLDVVRPLCAVVAPGAEELAPPAMPAVTVPRDVPGAQSPLRPVAPDDPVYALFTSGSTGTPKAVLLGSAALCNRIAWMAREFGLDGHDRVLQKTPYTFDVAGWEFFLPVVTGAACVFAPVDAHYDARAIGRVIAAERITVCHFVPTTLEAYLRLARPEDGRSLHTVVCSGEALPAPLAARFASRHTARLHNLYGPTEAAIDVTHWPVPHDIGPHDEVYIGAPIDNVDLRVLGSDGTAVADGEPGELWIGGVQTALGYVGRPDLTDAAFTVRDGRRWYRTGDLAAVEDGVVRYLGRIDAQVKIRGVRIEPGEVEAVLEAHPAIGRAAVVPVPAADGSGAELVAVAVRDPAARAGADDHAILAFVGERLPRAFVPRALRWTDRLPLTSSGKADRRRIGEEAARWRASAAQRPGDEAAEGPYGGGADTTGQPHGDGGVGGAVDREWWRVLGTPARQRRDDLGFLALGGHSLTAATLLARIASACRVDLPLSALLRDNVSLAGLRALAAQAAPRDEEAAPTTPRGHSPLTPAQEPLWLLNRALDDDSGYNVAGTLRVAADIDEPALRAALDDVVARHDALRAAVQVTGGVPRWSYAPRAAARLVTADAPEAAHAPGGPGGPDDAAAERFAARIAGRAIALERPPLMNAGLLRGPGQAVLVLSLHHLVADQRTLELVARDLAAAYTARLRGAAPRWAAEAPSFADFAHAQAAAVGSAGWRDDLAYWERLLADAPARTPLPFRLTPPAGPALAGRRFAADLGARASGRVDAFLARTGHTRATYFLSCVAAVLAGWAGEPAVAVGMPVSRRLRPREDELVGLVLGTVPLWLAAGGRPAADALLAGVRDRWLEALAHGTPTFQAIAHRLGLPPSPRDNPLFQVWVNDLSRIGPAPDFAGAPARWIDATPPAALFDLGFYLRRGDGYRFELVVREGLFEDAVAEELLRQTVAAAADLAAGRTPLGGGRPLDAAVPPTPAAPPLDVVAAIDAVAAARPGATAIVHGDRRWSYAETARHSRRTADAVAAAGVGPADVLELRATRTPALPATLLGAWRAGAAVAVTDAGLPAAVLAEQSALLAPKALLTPPPTPADPPALAPYPTPAPVTPTPATPTAATPAAAEPAAPAPPPTAAPEAPLPAAPVGAAPPASASPPAGRPSRRLPGVSHVLFTSGTSGRPAAVAVTGEALGGTLGWYVRAYGLGAADRVAMVGGLGHDPLLRDVLAPLLAGGTVVVPPEDVFAAPDRLFALLRDERVTVLHATPALLELIVSGRPAPGGGDRLDALRLVVSGGAPLTAGLLRTLRAVTAAAVVNAYGATETPQLASAQEVLAAGAAAPDALPDAAVLPVGSGVGGAELLVLRPDGSSAPVGHAGEIVVRSPYLAAGYLDGSGRADRFDRGHGAYRTGDRGRRTPDGSVVPDGRLDRQVEVDGHRLDPEQVERAALSHPGVRRALVRLAPTAAGPVLSLSVIAPPGVPAPAPAELRAHLRGLLPRHAVPAEVRAVAGFALDRRHKAAGAGPEAPGDAVRPDGPAEPGDAARPGDVIPLPLPAAGAGAGAVLDELAGLVREIVGADLSRTENFFDAGLNSMAVVRLHALLSERLATDFPVTAMFEHPNLTALARFLAGGPPSVPERDSRSGPPAGHAEGAQQRRQLRQRIRRDLEGRHEQPRRA